MTRSTPKLPHGYPRTTFYVAACIAIYTLMVFLAISAWPHYMRGGEPVSAEFRLDPSIEKLAILQQTFQWYFLGLAIGAGVVALGAYVFFLLVGLKDRNRFGVNGSQWRHSIVSIFWGAAGSFWLLLFRLPRQWSEVFGVAFSIITGILIVFLVVKVMVSVFGGDASKDGLDLLLKIVNLIFSIIFLVLNIEPLVETIGWLAKLRNIVALLSTEFAFGRFVLIAPMQVALALVPLVPGIMLMIWVKFCMPRSLSPAISARFSKSSLCMEKV